jgi:hypothetical protein
VSNLRSLPKQWNDAAMRRIAERLDRPRSGWPLLGMLALGLVAGAAIGGYVVSQRAHLKRLSVYTGRMGDELAGMDASEDERELIVPRSNQRRKATSEV